MHILAREKVFAQCVLLLIPLSMWYTALVALTISLQTPNNHIQDSNLVQRGVALISPLGAAMASRNPARRFQQ